MKKIERTISDATIITVINNTCYKDCKFTKESYFHDELEYLVFENCTFEGNHHFSDIDCTFIDCQIDWLELSYQSGSDAKYTVTNCKLNGLELHLSTLNLPDWLSDLPVTDLHVNYLSSLQDNLIGFLENCKTITSIEMSEMPSSCSLIKALKNMTTLKKLRLSCVGNQDELSWIVAFNQLQELELYCVKGGPEALRQFPEVVLELNTLEKFYLVQSAIDTLPENSTLSLKSLELTNNNITQIPDSWLPDSLEYLRIDSEPLTTAPEKIAKLTKLKGLHILLSNNIVTAPKIDALVNLEKLSLIGFALASIPRGINGLTALTLLNLRNNQIETFERDVLSSLVKLTSLDLSNNRITNIDDLVDILHKLKGCNVSNNQITYLSEPFLEKVSALKLKLDVSDNPLGASTVDMITEIDRDIEHLVHFTP